MIPQEPVSAEIRERALLRYWRVLRHMEGRVPRTPSRADPGLHPPPPVAAVPLLLRLGHGGRHIQTRRLPTSDGRRFRRRTPSIVHPRVFHPATCSPDGPRILRNSTCTMALYNHTQDPGTRPGSHLLAEGTVDNRYSTDDSKFASPVSTRLGLPDPAPAVLAASRQDEHRITGSASASRGLKVWRYISEEEGHHYMSALPPEKNQVQQRASVICQLRGFRSHVLLRRRRRPLSV